MAKRPLTIRLLCKEASIVAALESQHREPRLYGVTDGKAVGTYFELKFRQYLHKKYDFGLGNAAKGIDFPSLDVDMKVTSVRQPQSSCPYKSARQKIFGLGYSILLFVYEKTDDAKTQTGGLNILHTVFIEKERTADYQTTTGIRRILENNGNRDDLLAFFEDRMLPVDGIEALQIADELLLHPPEIGYLGPLRRVEWHELYSQAIEHAGQIDGIHQIR